MSYTQDTREPMKMSSLTSGDKGGQPDNLLKKMQGGSDTLSPIEEHYLKRELLRHQLQHELSEMGAPDGLRKFGYPFSSTDPKKISKSRLRLHKKHEKGSNLADRLSEDDASGAYPMSSFILRKFVMTFPLFSKNVSTDEAFWQTKVQVFYEHLMNMGFGSSYDREQLTKRERINMKLEKIILLIFNSGIGTTQERTYYEQDKKLFTLGENAVRKRSNVESFAIPTKSNLQHLITDEPVYMNGWDINIVAYLDSSTVRKVPTTSVSSINKPQDSFSATIASHSSNAFKATSKWMQNTFSVQGALSRLSIGGTSSTSLSSMASRATTEVKRRRKFLVKIRSSQDTNETIYVLKSYHNFRTLSKDLKRAFPGKKLPMLPHKIKYKEEKTPLANFATATRDGKVTVVGSQGVGSRDKIEGVVSTSEGFGEMKRKRKSVVGVLDGQKQEFDGFVEEQEHGEDEEAEEEEREEEEEDDEEEMGEEINASHLFNDKIRTALRQYLRSLCKDREIARCGPLTTFFGTDIVDYSTVSTIPEVKQEIKRREQIDVKNFETQLMFQRMALEKALSLQDSIERFRTNLLKDEDFFLKLVQEIKVKTKISELSPVLQDFIDWFKIYVASIIYQLFLGNDNSYGFFKQIRMLHRLMPYTVMEQIVKFTNPISIMKGLIDLFMAQPPQFVKGGQSLLQTIFSTILGDDLKNQKKTVKELEELILKESSNATSNTSTMLSALRKCVFNKAQNNPFSVEEVRRDSESLGLPSVLIILMKLGDRKMLAADSLAEVIESYACWKEDPSASGALYFQHIRQLLKLYVKEHDKRLMRQLWQDPELNILLKAIVSLVYEPMIKIFKVARMDIALRNFERFMSDLIKLMNEIITGQAGAVSQFDIIDSINKLLTKHQDSLFDFAHDVYVHDTENIFEGFIVWFMDIIKFLQRSKFGKTEGRIDFNAIIKQHSDSINIELLKSQIDDVIARKLGARKLYKQLVDLKVKKNNNNNNKNKSNSIRQTTNKNRNSNGNQSLDQIIEDKWKELHNMVIPSDSLKMGLDDGELVDLDLDTADYDYLKQNRETKLEEEYRALLSQDVNESEILKFRSLYMDDILRKTLALAE